MTSPANPEPQYADRVYRSVSGIVAGVLLLALCLWMATDAVVNGEGRTRWLALSALLLVVPVVIAFTLRPAVSAGADRVVVRNPFRTITLPWAGVEGLRSGYSHEILAGGRKYQMWALPVSLRGRKRAARAASRAEAGDRPGAKAGAGAAPMRAWSDQAADELRELAEKNAGRPGAQGEPSVRWVWEIIAPAAVGALALAVLWVTG